MDECLCGVWIETEQGPWSIVGEDISNFLYRVALTGLKTWNELYLYSVYGRAPWELANKLMQVPTELGRWL